MMYEVKRGGHRDLKRIYPMLEFDFRDWERPGEARLHAAFVSGGGELLLLKDEAGYEVGYAVALKSRRLRRVLIGWLAVYPNRRGEGAGTEFLRLIRERYAAMNGLLLEITEYPESEKSRRLHGLYTSAGFRDVECRYTLSGRESLLMWLPLNGPESLRGDVWPTLREVYGGLYGERELSRLLQVEEKW